MTKGQTTTEDILHHWKQGKSSLDWRRLMSVKEKREWLHACVQRSGIPNKTIRAFNYIIEGRQVSCRLDFYCLLGETFFGYGGYFGQDSHGFEDCFTEIFNHEKKSNTVENGTKVIIQDCDHLKQILADEFEHIIATFRANKFEIELLD